MLNHHDTSREAFDKPRSPKRIEFIRSPRRNIPHQRRRIPALRHSLLAKPGRHKAPRAIATKEPPELHEEHRKPQKSLKIANFAKKHGSAANTFHPATRRSAEAVQPLTQQPQLPNTNPIKKHRSAHTLIAAKPLSVPAASGPDIHLKEIFVPMTSPRKGRPFRKEKPFT